MASLIRTARFFCALSALSVKASMARRASFAMQVAFMTINNFIFFVFWWLLFARVPTIRGYAIADVAVLFGTVGAGFGLVQTFTGGVRHLARLIDEGELDGVIAQPQPTLLYALGMRSQASGIGDVISGLALYALSGKVSLAHVPFAALAILFSAAIFTATGVVFFSAAFWLGRIEGLARQAWELLITFSLYPEPLFGGAIRLLLFTALPAAFVGYVPARFVREPSWGGLATLCAATVAYAAIALWVFGRGLRRYTSGSRFNVLG
jgi:ABC-2 type transport system permease protein